MTPKPLKSSSSIGLSTNKNKHKTVVKQVETVVSDEKSGKCKYFNIKGKRKNQYCSNKEISFDKFKQRVYPPLAKATASKTSSNDMTVEVYLFENKTESKPNYEQVKAIIQKSPLNKSVENFVQSSHSIEPKKPNLCIPVYQKYIDQLKRVGNVDNLKEVS
jgi:hypothetical protein